MTINTTKKLAALALASAFVLTGCGKAPNAVSALRSQPSVPPAETPSYPGQPPMAGGSPENVAKAAQVIAAVAAAKPRTSTWTSKAHSDVTAPDGDRNWNVSQICFKAPNTMAAQVLTAKDDKTLKTKLVYKGGGDIDLKTYFFGFIAIKVNLAIDDSRLQDAYHRTLRDTQTRQLMDMILNPGAKATYLGKGKVYNQDVDFLDIVSPGSWKGITHEVVGISPTMACPLSRESFDSRGKRIFHLELENMRINYKPAANDFTLD
ncbi:MAG: hypothetical protein JWM80_6210 [Cyanobacteria bacterium RYN_339]|nr:hypothetical protein [Cyanobacteria bacterium RYN_339]